jgi:type II secretory pathway component PulF
MKRTKISLAVIWTGAVLTVAVWNYLLMFRIPIQAERFGGEDRQLPLITQYMIDLIRGRIVSAPVLLYGWTVLATVALFYPKSGMSQEHDRRRIAIVLLVYFPPIVLTTLTLLLPEVL